MIICITWCIGYSLIAVRDLFGLLFYNGVSFNNSGEDVARSMVAEACPIMVDQEAEKERGRKYRLQPGIC